MEPNTQPENTSTFSEAAIRLGITKPTLNKWRERGYFTAITPGNGYRRISESEILRLLKGRQVNG